MELIEVEELVLEVDKLVLLLVELVEMEVETEEDVLLILVDALVDEVE